MTFCPAETRLSDQHDKPYKPAGRNIEVSHSFVASRITVNRDLDFGRIISLLLSVKFFKFEENQDVFSGKLSLLA